MVRFVLTLHKISFFTNCKNENTCLRKVYDYETDKSDDIMGLFHDFMGYGTKKIYLKKYRQKSSNFGDII